jgi:hypothetical protein
MTDKLNNYDISETDDGKLLIQHPSINNKEVDAPQGPYLTINGAWYLDAYPNLIIAEMLDNTLKMFHLTPFRAIKEVDMRPYKGYHPRKCKGSPLPEYLYRFYGLARNDETLSEVVRVRLSPAEKEQLNTAAKNEGKTISEYLRDHIRGL